MTLHTEVEYANARYHGINRACTGRLLSLLKAHHDYAVQAPEGYAKPVPAPMPEPEIVIPVVVEFEQKKVVIADIQRAVARAFNVSRNDILGPKRIKKFTVPRHVAAYLSTELTQRSLPEIGSYFGGRDHTTIINSRKRINDWMAADSAFANRVNALRMELTR